MAADLREPSLAGPQARDRRVLSLQPYVRGPARDEDFDLAAPHRPQVCGWGSNYNFPIELESRRLPYSQSPVSLLLNRYPKELRVIVVGLIQGLGSVSQTFKQESIAFNF